jgi:hypothetical protein
LDTVLIDTSQTRPSKSYSISSKNRIGVTFGRGYRDISLVDDACSKAMTLAAHREWIRLAANQLKCGGDTLWQAMCAEWASKFAAGEARKVIRPIEETI